MARKKTMAHPSYSAPKKGNADPRIVRHAPTISSYCDPKTPVYHLSPTQNIPLFGRSSAYPSLPVPKKGNAGSHTPLQTTVSRVVTHTPASGKTVTKSYFYRTPTAPGPTPKNAHGGFFGSLQPEVLRRAYVMQEELLAVRNKMNAEPHFRFSHPTQQLEKAIEALNHAIGQTQETSSKVAADAAKFMETMNKTGAKKAEPAETGIAMSPTPARQSSASSGKSKRKRFDQDEEDYVPVDEEQSLKATSSPSKRRKGTQKSNDTPSVHKRSSSGPPSSAPPAMSTRSKKNLRA